MATSAKYNYINKSCLFCSDTDEANHPDHSAASRSTQINLSLLNTDTRVQTRTGITQMRPVLKVAFDIQQHIHPPSCAHINAQQEKIAEVVHCTGSDLIALIDVLQRNAAYKSRSSFSGFRR